MIEYTDGDILDAPAECIVNPVNCHGRMGKGLALLIAKRFPGVLPPYQKFCANRSLRPGMLQLVRVDRASGLKDPDGDLYIMNLPTKDHWNDKSRLDWIETALAKVPAALAQRGIGSIALPKLGSGLGGLEWERVRPLIVAAMGAAPVRTLVYGEAPTPAPAPGLGLGAVRSLARPPARPAPAAVSVQISPHEQPIVAGIGARASPSWALEVMADAGEALARLGWMLRSGGATGADDAFQRGWERVPGPMQIFLPWKGFEGRASPYVGASPVAWEIAERFHDKWYVLKQGAKQLQARNTHQILGPNPTGIDDRSDVTDLVICWTVDGKIKGGTGQALRIAELCEIPVINLGEPRWENACAADVAAEAVRLMAEKRPRTEAPGLTS